MQNEFRALTIAVALLAGLSGCASMHAGTADGAGVATPDVRLRVGRSVAGLRLLVADLSAPAGTGPASADGATLIGLIEDARVAVITAGALHLDQPGLAAKAELATLTLLLTHCRDRARAAQGLAAGSDEARHAARTLGQRCVAPLVLMLG